MKNKDHFRNLTEDELDTLNMVFRYVETHYPDPYVRHEVRLLATKIFQKTLFED